MGMWYKVFKDITSLQKKEWNAAMDKTIGHTGLVKAVNSTAGTVRLGHPPLLRPLSRSS